MKVFGLLVGLVIVAGCSDDSGPGGSGGGPSSGGAPPIGGTGGAPATGGGGEGGAGGDPGPHTRVFVTSTTFNGTFGGLVGADAECQERADSAGLGGIWLAWLSENPGESPSTRFLHSPLPYRLVGGEQVADDWDDLIDGSIDASIDHDEAGAQISPDVLRVWTGTDVDATSFSPCCTNWTTTESGAITGDTSTSDDEWTFIGGQPCANLAHFYCFEQ